jgi:hypothetical protein
MELVRLLGIVLVAVVAIGLAIVAVAYLVLTRDIAADVDRLVAAAQPSNVTITEEMLATLPQPAQRYLRAAGVVGQPIPRVVRLTQTGRIRSSYDAAWMAFEAEETYSTNPPAFVWRASFPSHSLPVVMGRDLYLAGQGSIAMRMLALVPMANEQGEEMRAAGLMRYLNEMMWFPAAFLGPAVTIEPAGPDGFSATIVHDGISATARLFIDADGRLVDFEAIRFSTSTHSLETWRTPLRAWRRFGDLLLPSKGAAVWRLPGGDLDYIELDVTSVTHIE